MHIKVDIKNKIGKMIIIGDYLDDLYCYAYP